MERAEPAVRRSPRRLRLGAGGQSHDNSAQVDESLALRRGDFVQQLRASIDTAIRPVLDHEGIELVNVEWFQMGKRGLLRLYIDKHGGVTITDCASISSVVEDILDVENIVEGPYTLEVSSPGLERPLKSRADIERSLGRKVRIITKSGGTLSGRLVECGEMVIVVDVGDQLVEIPIASMAKARLEFER